MGWSSSLVTVKTSIKDAQLERDDTDLRFIEPETAENIDVGLRYSSAKFNANITYYTIEFNNRIQFTSNETASGIDFLEAAAGGYRNVGGIESSGFEMSADFAITDNLTVFTSLTLSESEYIETIGGTGTQYDSLASAQAAIADTTNAESSRFIDIYNTAEVDDYLVSDLYIGGYISNIGQGMEELEVRLTVNNVLDEDYASTIAPNAFWIGAPRAVAINARLTF